MGIIFFAHGVHEGFRCIRRPADLLDDGKPFVAMDASAQAPSGDLVTWEAAREAALLHEPWFIPVDHAVVGIVEQHALENPERRS